MRPTDEYKTYCANFASAPTTSALDRIGARIPEEVLARISFLIQGEYHERRIVGHMALTCKYWATQCQPVIFNVIRLRSGKDLEELLSLMASPLSRVASYIKRLSLWQYGRPDAPWLHLVALRLVPKLSLNTEDPINLSFYNDGAAAAIRSIHDGLPRSCHSFSSHISWLSLENARFNSCAELLHLVDEMPSLRTLLCYEVA